MKDRRIGLRLASPNEVDENLAVETARLHATTRSLTWNQYVRNLDFSLGLQLEPESAVGDFR